MVARRYRGQVARYSIWNEPNLRSWLQGRNRRETPAGRYRKLYIRGYKAIKRADRRAAVLIGELALYGRRAADHPVAFLRRVTCTSAAYRRARGCSGLRADGVAVHPYEFGHRSATWQHPNPDVVSIGSLRRFNRSLGRLRRAGALRTPSGRTPGIYLTEFGHFAPGSRRAIFNAAGRGRYLEGGLHRRAARAQRQADPPVHARAPAVGELGHGPDQPEDGPPRRRLSRARRLVGAPGPRRQDRTLTHPCDASTYGEAQLNLRPSAADICRQRAKRTLMMRAMAVTIGLAFLASAPAASAAPWTPPKPKQGHASYAWIDYGCKMDAQGQQRSYAKVRTNVLKLKSKYGMFQQKVKVQIDRIAGYDDSNPTWREVDSTTATKGDTWFQKGGTPGTSIGLPDSAIASIHTGMQPDTGQLSAKVTVWLKRYGSPKAVWRYKVRSRTFECPGFSLGPPPSQLPSANSG